MQPQRFSHPLLYRTVLSRPVYQKALAFGLLFLALVMATLPATINAQGSPTAVPLTTLVPPTLLPLPPSPTATPLPVQSAVARIKARLSAVTSKPILVVGIPYNIPPFARITETGAIEGFEADIARAISEDWGTDLQFVPVTKHNALPLLLSGQIDFLIGKQVLERDRQSELDFSSPYFANRQVALAMADAAQADVRDLNGQAVGVVAGSTSEAVLRGWSGTNGFTTTVVTFPMMDDALEALYARQIVAVIGDRWELDQIVGGGRVTGIKLLNGAIRVEPYAIAMIRYDDSLRTLIERTLQRLVSRGTLGSIYDRWFPGSDLLPEDKLFPRVWRDLDSDPRTFNDFGNDLVRPTQPVLARLRSGGTLRVAGLGEPAGITGQPSPLEGFNQAIVEEMARRWGVPVEYIPNSYGQGENIIVANNADLAVGMEAKWGGAFDRIDFTGFYAQRGYRLMVRVGSGIESFAGFATGRRGVAVYTDDATGFDMAKKLMEQAGILSESAQKVTFTTGDEIVDAVFNNNVRAGFADAFRFLPLANANTAKVVLTPRLYDPKPIAFGLQRNDPDFRLLIEATLQEMAKDGTYQRLWAERFNLGDPLSVTQYPGTTTVFGYKVGN